MTAADLREKIHAARLHLDGVPLPDYLTADLGVDTLAAIWRITEPDLDIGRARTQTTSQPKQEKICGICSKMAPMRRDQKTCGADVCKTKWKNRKTAEIHATKKREPLPRVPCVVCGREDWTRRDRRQVLCSARCRQARNAILKQERKR